MKSCEKCGRPIADTAAACPYCGYSQAAELPNALQPGWEIAGRYRIESVIGLGGFGITYCAYDQKLACTVALKEYFPSGVANRIPGSKEVILYAGKRTEEFRQGYTRFLNEARNMIQFQSVPNVVQVREYFEENGTAYIAMEYLRGHTLKTEIERAPLTWERAVTIGAVICGALTALHRKGIVHRDVSPDNIFLCDDGRIKLIDFGAARVSMQQTPLTVVFKDCFTPPEQYSRSAHQGPQTDIYALGATLYTAMLGKKPESALNRWPTDHLKAPHTLKPEIPEPVSNAVMQALALEDRTVSGLLLDERWRKSQEAFGPELAAASEEDDGAWRRPPLMDVDGQGNPAKTMKNLRTALEHNPSLMGRLRLNLFSGRIDITGELPWKRPGTAHTWGDDDAAQLRIYLEPFFGKVPKNDVLDAVAACASDQAYHPVRDYLNSLAWDGAERLDTLFVDYLGAEDSPYTRAVTRKAFTAAVARVMRPGCKFDTMLVLIGGQGRHKSTILAKMGGEWFSDSLRTFGDKDSMETIQGTWVNEVAEMHEADNYRIAAMALPAAGILFIGLLFSAAAGQGHGQGQGQQQSHPSLFHHDLSHFCHPRADSAPVFCISDGRG